MKKLVKSCVAGVLLSTACGVLADEAADVRKNLERMPRPWKAANYSPAPEAETYANRANTSRISKLDWVVFESALRFYDQKYPYAKLSVAGKTLENDPIYYMTVTDPEVPAEKKFRILAVANHGGGERSALHSAMAILEYIVSPEAAEFRKKYEIIMIPSGNIFGFFRSETPMNSKGIDPYAAGRGNHWDIKNLVPKKPENTPELVSFCKLLDEFHPEILIDFHGVGRFVPGEIMTQYIGPAGSNHVIRPWANDLIDHARKYANESGFTLFPLDEEIQRLVAVNDARKAFPKRFRDSGDYYYSDMYPYLKYHTMPIIFEIGYEKTAVAAFKGIMDYGMNLPAERNGSLPVDNILTDWGGFMVQSWGTNPGEKRASRVELWSKVEEMQTFSAYPPQTFRIIRGVSFGGNGAKEIMGDFPYKYAYNIVTSGIFDKMQDSENMSWSAIKQFLKLGPEVNFLSVNSKTPEAKAPQNGISFAQDIQISAKHNVEMLDVRVNGKPLKEDARDGYQLIKHDYGHRLIINVPPEKSSKCLTFFITAAYTSDAPVHWGWVAKDNIPKNSKGLAFAYHDDGKPLLFEENFEKEHVISKAGDYFNGTGAVGFFKADGGIKFGKDPQTNSRCVELYSSPLVAWVSDIRSVAPDKEAILTFDYFLPQKESIVFRISQRGKANSVAGVMADSGFYAHTLVDGKFKNVRTPIRLPYDTWVKCEVKLEKGFYSVAFILPDGKRVEAGKFARLNNDGFSQVTFGRGAKGTSFSGRIDNIKITK